VLPEIPGLDIAARYRPAKSTALVGGDFYDMFEVSPDVWNIMIGDVSGVGPEAAALTGIARYAARALASQEASPARVLGQLNDTLVRFGFQERFCTLLYLQLHQAGDRLRLKIANGGHPYPMVLHPNGRVEEVAISGALLGLLAEAAFTETEFVMAPGDMMVCYTDGVTEARNPSGEFFGTDGLAGILPGSTGRSAASVARRVELAVLEHQSGVSPDDIAIVVLQPVPG
jgi:phosphoserine phosphatase RsbU/P